MNVYCCFTRWLRGCRIAAEADATVAERAAAAETALATAGTAVRAAAAVGKQESGSGSGQPVTAADLPGLAAARLTAWRARNPDAANFQVRGF